MVYFLIRIDDRDIVSPSPLLSHLVAGLRLLVRMTFAKIDRLVNVDFPFFWSIRSELSLGSVHLLVSDGLFSLCRLFLCVRFLTEWFDLVPAFEFVFY